MKCSVIPFTHICDWKRCSPSSYSSGSSSWICVVEMMTLGSTTMIHFPLSLTMTLGLESESEPRSDSKAWISTTSDCFERHSSMLCHGLLWNSHHFPVSFFVFLLPFFAYDLDKLSEGGLSLLCPLFYMIGFPFPYFYDGFADLNSRLFFYLIFFQFWQHMHKRHPNMICQGNPFRFTCTNARCTIFQN